MDFLGIFFFYNNALHLAFPAAMHWKSPALSFLGEANLNGQHSCGRRFIQSPGFCILYLKKIRKKKKKAPSGLFSRRTCELNPNVCAGLRFHCLVVTVRRDLCRVGQVRLIKI